MKLKTGVNVTSFLKQVERCRGEVFLVTPEDHLNLKSTLSQYVFVVIEANDELSGGAQVMCETEDDYAMLAGYLEG